MGDHTRRQRAFRIATRGALVLLLALGAGGASRAGEGSWTVEIEGIFMDAYGHDQHVLNVHERDFDPIPELDGRTAVTLDTASELAWRGAFRYERGRWGFGADFFWFLASQDTGPRTAAAGGAIDEVVFEIADRDFSSTDPGEVLFYQVLEDTDLSMWHADLYATRMLAGTDDAAVWLLFGARFADFDNDYHAVVGIQGDEGVLLGSSSNYGLMPGPLVGLGGEVRFGRSRVEGRIDQSVALGSAELSNVATRFTGPFDTPSFFEQETFRSEPDVAIPITEVRLKWSYDLTERVSLGVGAHTSIWWDVPVPPGVIPGEDGDRVLHENTVVLFGLLGGVKLRF